MQGLALSNPLTAASSSSIGFEKWNVDCAGRSLSGGKIYNNDVVSSFIGNSLNDTGRILSKVNANIAYSTNALKITQNSLEKIASTLSDAIAIVAQSTGNSDNNRATLNSMLQKKLEQVELQTKNAEFDGRALLTGALGADPTIDAQFKNKSVSVKSLGTVLTGGNAAFANAGTAGVTTLTIGAALAANEYIDFAGQRFTFVSGNPTKDSEIKLATTTNETAQNLATAILNSKSEALKDYSIDVNGADVIVTQLSASASVIPINATNAANITNTVTTAGTTGALDLSGINDITDFINTPTATFSVVNRFSGLTSRAEALKYGNVAAQAATANAGDATAVYTVTIAGKVFNGSVFLPNGTATVNNLQANFVHADTGEKFTATFGAANGNNLAAGANTTAIATHLTNLFANTRFNQTQMLKINTDVGDVFDSTGSRIGSTTGMTASLTSTNFQNKKFTDVAVKDAGGGNVTIEVKAKDVNGTEQTFSVTRTSGAQISAMVKGFKLDLTDSVSGDVLTLNLGEAGLTNLSSVKNHATIEKMLKSALLKEGSGLDVRVGKDFESVINISVSDISASKIYRDNQQNYIKTLSIIDESDAGVAQEVLENALKMIRNEQSSITSQLESVTQASQNLQSQIDITQDAADGYLNTDYISAAKTFKEGLSRIQAAVSAMQAGNKITEAAQSILRDL